MSHVSVCPEEYSHINDPDGDGTSKLDHVREMLTHVVDQKRLPFRTVLMDSWYATKEAMLTIEQWARTTTAHARTIVKWMSPVALLPISVWTRWTGATMTLSRQMVKIKGFPKDHKVQRFRVVVSPQRTDYVVTNDLAQDATEATQGVWLPLENRAVASRKQAADRVGMLPVPQGAHLRHHIACAFLVWVRLKELAANRPHCLPGQTWACLETISFSN